MKKTYLQPQTEDTIQSLLVSVMSGTGGAGASGDVTPGEYGDGDLSGAPARKLYI